MGRPLRIDYAGAWHHVMNRGASRYPVFHHDRDFLLFLSILEDASNRYRLEVHGYSLMPNHYHLLVRSLDGQLSLGMAYLSSRFTRTLNGRYGLDGARFRGRFRNRLVEDDDYLRTILAYLHLNPVEAHLVSRPDDECWTSHRAYMGLDERPQWLHCEALLSLFGDENVLDGQIRELHQGSVEWPPDLPLYTEKLWLLMGTQDALGRLQNRDVVPQARPIRAPEEILALVSELTGASREELMEVRRGPRANPARRFGVWVLSRDARLTNREIGQLLGMSPNQVNLVLSRLRRQRIPTQLDRWMDRWKAKSK